jgi:hypothetical protein
MSSQRQVLSVRHAPYSCCQPPAHQSIPLISLGELAQQSQVSESSESDVRLNSALIGPEAGK